MLNYIGFRIFFVIFMGYEFNSEYCVCKCLRSVMLFCIGEVV